MENIEQSTTTETQTETQNTSEQQNDSNWLQQEADNLKQNSNFDGEQLPSLNFESNKITKFTVNFSEKFKTWEDSKNGNVKALIPVNHMEDNKILWLNMKNPLYMKIVMQGLEGKKNFSVLQTGQQKETIYTIVED